MSSVGPSAGNVAAFTPHASIEQVPNTGRHTTVRLERLCLARSGDKGDTCNIGCDRSLPGGLRLDAPQFDSEFVKAHFEGICHGQVERHELPNLLAMNFLLHESLGGGGTLSLLLDAQGKTYSQYLLSAEVTVDAGLVECVERRSAGRIATARDSSGWSSSRSATRGAASR